LWCSMGQCACNRTSSWVASAFFSDFYLFNFYFLKTLGYGQMCSKYKNFKIQNLFNWITWFFLFKVETEVKNCDALIMVGLMSANRRKRDLGLLQSSPFVPDANSWVYFIFLKFHFEILICGSLSFLF
jgi:hypothetical protein